MSLTFLAATAAAMPTEPWTWFFLFLAVGLALSFEFVNGFHDTANAVATVIYTHTLKPVPAVIWSGLWNLIGVLLSSGAVAFGIVNLLPVELVLNIGSAAGFAMVFSLLVSAILWNLGTWYFGLPASSSHTLIGSILGVGLANALMSPSHNITAGVNWSKAEEVGMALLFSPLVGFCMSALLLIVAKILIKNEALFKAPEGKAPPPTWIRGLLMLTCTGVSFAHGSNDGQKGMGLIMLILVGIVPGMYALNMSAPGHEIQKVVASADVIDDSFEAQAKGVKVSDKDSKQIISTYIKPEGKLSPKVYAALDAKCDEIVAILKSVNSFEDLPANSRGELRTDFFLISKAIDKLKGQPVFPTAPESKAAGEFQKDSKEITNYIPTWVKVAVAFALGLGTMIGWKRIVVTVGEKIGKTHLTYAQGASAELTAMVTIGMATVWGLPVSTTHVLSSGIAGTMAANRSGLQMQTLRNIVLAWVLTLPVCIFLGAMLFAFALNLIALMKLH